MKNTLVSVMLLASLQQPVVTAQILCRGAGIYEGEFEKAVSHGCVRERDACRAARALAIEGERGN